MAMYGPPEQQTLEGAPIASPIIGTEKKCRVCGVGLNHLNCSPSIIAHKEYICRECNNKIKLEWCKRNPEKTKVSGRERMRKWRELNPDKDKDASRRSYQNNAERAKEYSRTYSKNNREIKNAQLAAYYAVKRGIIEKQPCKICGELNVEKHHPDYSKRTEIEWLCPKHHHRAHKWII